ncbi:hypothetical protein [Bythopirellula polymerisocia]|uniref:DUF1570 domain-containing protein n=1 Tax=Bythopirellula polymerisocia TaxID=2528003 RepID=A0A5C6CZW0_9BACT|nr:hypothetical protein [Bythopirellula polymerisocia]TWU30413.1 hypothetical protein Pla144_11990 [Bythopirellula polymerisocia]
MPLINMLLLTVLSVSTIAASAQTPSDWPAPRVVDLARAASVGIREITGQHLKLWTDVPASTAVDELPQVFDAAIRQWAEYFGIPEKQIANWQVQGFLIRERAKFAALGLLPEGHHEYLNGYAVGNELWLDEQDSDYYRRHLLLHEGTHSFMLAFLGSAGPGWYMEGTAELLGTHRWQEKQLNLNVFPSNREEVPLWGRIKLILEAHANGSALSLGQVLAIDNRQALTTEAYAWSWALCKFLDSHPDYGKKFRKLPRLVQQPDFNSRFRKLFHQEWADMNVAWEAFVAEMDYGYDTEQMAMQHRAAKAVDESAMTSVEVDRGWQSTGWLLRGGLEYQVTASGSYEIANDGEPWPCEPGGVTIRYLDGKPLGMLLGVLRSVKSQRDSPANEKSDFAHPLAIGMGATIKPAADTVLYLRVNDSPAELSDNQGALEVRIEPSKSTN